MKNNLLYICSFILSLSIISAYSNVSFAQTSEMMSQFSGMSPSAKKDLAKQYGVDLQEFGIGNVYGEDESIGNAGEEITSDVNQVLYKRIINAQENTRRAEEYKRNNIPIFDRDYESVKDLPIYGQFLFDGEYSTFAPS